MNWTVFALNYAISLSYVAVLYVTSKGIEDFPARRDDPRVIMKRMKNVSIVCIINLLWVPMAYAVLSDQLTYKEAFLGIGLIPGYYRNDMWDINSFVIDIIKVLALVALLYVGPLSDKILYYITNRRASPVEDMKNEVMNIWGIRNYIFAPITEEIFYTSMLLNTYLVQKDGRLSLSTMLVQPSMFFSIAHIHHAYEATLVGNFSMSSIILNTVFQMVYTTLFGAFTNFVYLKTGGNLWACILAHTFCNLLGFPDGSAVHEYFTVIRTPSSLRIQQLVSYWNKIYYILLLMGILFFKDNLFNLVSSPYELA
ncbi:CAAX prenyl protease 2 [Nakaseomyces bracarensis]|uniref:intramembrane prenyl-peptidase Rce1 n=1 Tax=Nakaseomyces bracarensis TaxID=273131 RepID=A0ABR4NZC5_9SACH